MPLIEQVQWTAVCSLCDTYMDIFQGENESTITNSRAAAAQFRREGWVIGTDTPRNICPYCNPKSERFGAPHADPWKKH